MEQIKAPRTRKLTIVAQDPSIKGADNRILTTQVEVPAEVLDPGPRGYRVSVVDYDATRGVLLEPARIGKDASEGDRFCGKGGDEVLLESPAFHAQNVYAIVMRTLARFEKALGRRVSWSFGGHQLQVAPHAFAEPNAFYSSEDQGILFGYFFTEARNPVFTCLSHDVVAHETTHAVLDGLRERFIDPSLPDQAAFHEGLADIVALLSVFSLRDVVERIVRASSKMDGDTLRPDKQTADWLRNNPLLWIAEQLGAELGPTGSRAKALRRSLELGPSQDTLSKDKEFEEEHRRGEVLVAAVINAFVSIWECRLQEMKEANLPLRRVWEEGAEAADHLLTIVIRSLDYCPPVDLQFGEFLSALLTADMELVPDDGKYRYRERLRQSFAAWGISPASPAGPPEPGVWEHPDVVLSYDRLHLEALQRAPDEVFRFLWENRQALKLHDDAFSRVISVRPCVRVGPDGFVLRETAAEYTQQVDLEARDLGRFGLKAPEGMKKNQAIRLQGGGTVLFDEFGELKYHVRKRIDNREFQQKKLDHLWRGRDVDPKSRLGVSDGTPRGLRFAMIHRARSGFAGQAWDL